MTSTYRCPVCGKPLTKREYEQALGILGERERHLKHEKEELKKKLLEAKTKERKAKEEGIKVERARTQRLLVGKDKQIQVLKERIDQLKKGSTPQTEGLEFEDELCKRLKKEFPEDDIKHTGKGGDIVHIVMSEKITAGVIVYECKRTPKIMSQHISQARAAKQSREADFAILVTTGQRKGFSGLSQINNVLLVSPLGVVSLASLLRDSLITMLRARIQKEKRALVAQQLLEYVTCPQFKNPIEEVVHITDELQGTIKEEFKSHMRNWQRRWVNYQTIHWDSSQVQANLRLILQGKEPKPIGRPDVLPLQLPPATE